MDKKQYLYELSKQLKDLDNEALRFVEEYFDEAGPQNEKQVIEELGSPEKYATQIKAECAAKEAEKQQVGGSPKNNMKTIWIIILGIFALPIAGPLLAAAIAIIFAILACLFAFAIAGGALLIGGLVAFLPLFISAIALFSISVPGGMFATGLTIAFAGGFIFVMSLYYIVLAKAIPATMRFTASTFKKLKHKMQSRRDSQ